MCSFLIIMQSSSDSSTPKILAASYGLMKVARIIKAMQIMQFRVLVMILFGLELGGASKLGQKQKDWVRSGGFLGPRKATIYILFNSSSHHEQRCRMTWKFFAFVYSLV